MSGIEVREWSEGGVVVELRGEFDRHDLEDVRETLSSVVALRRPTLVDLAGVTFLDVGVSRELAVRSRLYAHHLTLSNPSWQARASAAACGFGEFLSVSPHLSCAVLAAPGDVAKTSENAWWSSVQDAGNGWNHP